MNASLGPRNRTREETSEERVTNGGIHAAITKLDIFLPRRVEIVTDLLIMVPSVSRGVLCSISHARSHAYVGYRPVVERSQFIPQLPRLIVTPGCLLFQKLNASSSIISSVLCPRSQV